MGYSVLNATNFGVPQNRERVYIIGFEKGAFPKINLKEEINNILSDAFTPSSDSDNNSNKTTKAGVIGNYTWNWGAV